LKSSKLSSPNKSNLSNSKNRKNLKDLLNEKELGRRSSWTKLPREM